MREVWGPGFDCEPCWRKEAQGVALGGLETAGVSRKSRSRGQAAARAQGPLRSHVSSSRELLVQISDAHLLVACFPCRTTTLSSATFSTAMAANPLAGIAFCLDPIYRC